MTFTKTITVTVSGEEDSDKAFNSRIHDYEETIFDMGNIYEESGYEVVIGVGPTTSA